MQLRDFNAEWMNEWIWEYEIWYVGRLWVRESDVL